MSEDNRFNMVKLDMWDRPEGLETRFGFNRSDIDYIFLGSSGLLIQLNKEINGHNFVTISYNCSYLSNNKNYIDLDELSRLYGFLVFGKIKIPLKDLKDWLKEFESKE